jgi:TetR/AcrR family transcriptional regulator of autoinduction and epiphytic fitness
MEQFAAAAGVGVRTLYRLFGSRQALLREAGYEPRQGARERVLNAALEQVGRQGLAALSMDELAATAGVSRATLYRLFPGKNALFGELVRTFSPWEPVADVLVSMPDGDPADVIPAVAHAIADAMDGRVGLLLRMVFELLRGDPDTTEGLGHSMARGLPDLAHYLTAQMHAGRLRRMHPVLALQMLAGPIAVHLLTEPLAENLISFDTSQTELINEIAQTWLRAMTAGENV